MEHQLAVILLELISRHVCHVDREGHEEAVRVSALELDELAIENESDYGWSADG